LDSPTTTPESPPEKGTGAPCELDEVDSSAIDAPCEAPDIHQLVRIQDVVQEEKPGLILQPRNKILKMLPRDEAADA